MAWNAIEPDSELAGEAFDALSPESPGRGAFNTKGLDFYQRFVDRLLDHGIRPHATLFYWDSPQALKDRYGSWRSRESRSMAPRRLTWHCAPDLYRCRNREGLQSPDVRETQRG